ncbi:ClbS/DfsB family four-helix bundle protein [Candidatus Saccharibacteria bacterium]|nr:ClbS/DfsB family four-helix bundle protein [Candidatus Saccharibacteria bacterium]
MGRPKNKEELIEQAEGNFEKLMELVEEKVGEQCVACKI